MDLEHWNYDSNLYMTHSDIAKLLGLCGGCKRKQCLYGCKYTTRAYIYCRKLGLEPFPGKSNGGHSIVCFYKKQDVEDNLTNFLKLIKRHPENQTNYSPDSKRETTPNFIIDYISDKKYIKELEQTIQMLTDINESQEQIILNIHKGLDILSKSIITKGQAHEKKIHNFIK